MNHSKTDIDSSLDIETKSEDRKRFQKERERNSLLEERNKVHKENNRLLEESNKVHKEKNELHKEKNELHKESNSLLEENNRLLEERIRLLEERKIVNSSITSRDIAIRAPAPTALVSSPAPPTVRPTSSPHKKNITKTVKRKKKSTKKKNSKKDPNKPKRPCSSFLLYRSYKRIEIKKKHPELNEIEISKMLKDTWKTEDKSKWKAKAAENWKIYKTNMRVNKSRELPPPEVAAAAPTSDIKKKPIVNVTDYKDAFVIKNVKRHHKELIQLIKSFDGWWTGTNTIDNFVKRLVKNPEPKTWHIKKVNCDYNIDEMNYVLSKFVTTEIFVKTENYYK